MTDVTSEALIAVGRSDEWQLEEIHKAIEELDSRQAISHDEVSAWLKSWATADETKAPLRE